MRRGQASLEQLIITGIALFIVAMIFYFSINYARDSVRIAQGKDAVEKLAKSADYVHALGEGAKTKVNLYIPEGVEFINASGGRIQMRISLSSGETDIFANTQAGLVGEIPIISGANQVSVATTANGNVMFGDNYISCSPTSIVRSFVQGGSGNDSVVISNIADFIITDISANLSGEAVGMVGVGSYASSLGAGNSTQAGLYFSIPSAQAVGTYGATLRVSASNFSECSTHITVSVSSSSGPDVQGPVVTSIAHSPASPNNATAIVINASATEVGVGNGTISLCQLALDASGVWNDMGGTYGQIAITVAYSLGMLETGAHNVSVRCIDSESNIGNLGTDSFVVTAAAETQGPIVTFIAGFPANATTLTSVVVNATASDAGTGASNISLCELQLDAGAYNAMTAVGSAYGTSIVQNVTYTLGTLATGTHNVSVRCNDSAGNQGGTYNSSFSVQKGYVKNMLFITLAGGASTVEARWQTWINSHASNESFNWSFDAATVASVASGSTNLSNYRIVVMADSQGANANFWGNMNNYTATSHYAVLAGSSMQFGLFYMGGASANSSSENNRRVVPRSAHYITSGYTVGTAYTIHAANNQQWYSTAFFGTNVGSTSTSSARGMIIDDTANFVLTFGDTRPDSFNANGDVFAMHVLDYALLNSG